MLKPRKQQKMKIFSFDQNIKDAAIVINPNSLILPDKMQVKEKWTVNKLVKIYEMKYILII